MKVRKGGIYRFERAGWDIIDPKNCPAIPDGLIVRVVRPHGCPPPNTMGMCHIETVDGKFLGLCATASLNTPSEIWNGE